MKSPRKKAEELIADFIQMMPDGIDKLGYEFKTQYEVAKCRAEYAAHVAKFSHEKDSDQFQYWKNVQDEIRQL